MKKESSTVPAQTQNVPPVFAINPRPKDNATGKVVEKYNTLSYAEPATAEQVLTMIGREDVSQTTASLRRQYDEQVKLWQLPYACPHYSEFSNCHRAQEDIIPEAFTHQTCVDIDEAEKALMAIERALQLNSDEMSEWQDSVLYIDHSTRKPKCHIWIRMPVGKTIEETQRMFCQDLGEDLGVEPDPQCFTPERLILMTGDTVYRSERWLQPLSEEELEERREAFLQRGLDVDGRPLAKPETPSQQPVATTSQPAPKQTSVVAVTPRLRYIFDRFVKLTGQPESNFHTENFRHNMVKAVLSVGADRVMTETEMRACLLEKMGPYSQGDDISRLVADFYSKYNEPAQRFTRDQLRIMADAQRKFPQNESQTAEHNDPDTTDEQTAPVYGDTASLSDIYASHTPPMLSKDSRPRFVKTATGPVPAESLETAAQAMFPPTGMYCDAKFVYIDNTPRELRSNCCIIAGTGIGKDSSTKHMLKHLEAPQKAEDGPNRKMLEDWKTKCKAMKDNADKPQRPDVSVRSVAADITKARLSELMADSQGRIVHTRMVELDQWFGVEGWKPSPNCPFTYMKMTDDEDNPFGQERVGKESITYQGPLSINWNASTTPGKAQYYFRNNMTDGPISRLVLATAPDRGLGAPMPKHGKYDEKYDAALKTFIDNLREVHGLVECKQAQRLVTRLKKELDDFVVQSGDEVLNNLGRRALVAAFRKACTLYAANGRKWEKAIEGFCRWSMHYDLWLKLHFFGDLIRSADKDVHTSHRGPQNMLALLDNPFSIQQLMALRLQRGMKEEGTRFQVAKWLERGLVKDLGNGNYQNLVREKQA